jgi:hypothetical protein
MADKNADSVSSNEPNTGTDAPPPPSRDGAVFRNRGSFRWDEKPEVIKKEMDKGKTRSGS